MRRAASFLVPIIAATALAGCGEARPKTVTIDGARVVLPAVRGRPGVAYFTVHGGSQPAQLVSIESPRIGSIELHQSMKGAGGMMSMDKLDTVDVPAGQDVAFAPEGRHAMLFAIDATVTPGDEVPLSFRFARGQPIAVKAKAEKPGS